MAPVPAIRSHRGGRTEDRLTVRPARPEDAPALKRVDGRAEPHLAWVAEAEGDLRGFLSEGRFFGRPFLDLIVVTPAWRRRGVGRALVRTWIEAHPGEALFSSCNLSNVPSQSLLRSAGFEECGYVDGLDEEDRELIFRREG